MKGVHIPILLAGYDVEAAAIGEGLARLGDHGLGTALESRSTAEGLEVIASNHEELGVPATLFVCGRTLLHNVEALRAKAADPLYDVQQHTYSHMLFKEDGWKGGAFPAAPLPALRFEVTATSGLLAEHLGVECTGIRAPHGYHLGLSDRPEHLRMLHDAGIRFISSWGRNPDGQNPTPLDVQPFWYARQGFPDMLEIPFQGWLDGTWFEAFGPQDAAGYLAVLQETVDEIVARDLVYGVCFHDWAMVHYHEAERGWARGLLEYALAQGVEVMSYRQYHERRLKERT